MKLVFTIKQKNIIRLPAKFHDEQSMPLRLIDKLIYLIDCDTRYRRRAIHRRRRGTIRYDTRCYFNVRSKANMSQLNIPHGTDN